MNSDAAIQARKSMEKILGTLFRDYERQYPTDLILSVRVYRQGNLLPILPAIGDVAEVVIATTGSPHA